MTKETINAANRLVIAIEANIHSTTVASISDYSSDYEPIIKLQYITEELEELKDCLRHWEDILETETQGK
jgi:predicted translin family RNA/ssDNA-binding protein